MNSSTVKRKIIPRLSYGLEEANVLSLSVRWEEELVSRPLSSSKRWTISDLGDIVQANVRAYYQQFEEQQTQSLIDQKVKEHLGQTAAGGGTAFQQHLAALQAGQFKPPILGTAPGVLPSAQPPLLPNIRLPVLPPPTSAGQGTYHQDSLRSWFNPNVIFKRLGFCCTWSSKNAYLPLWLFGQP